MATQTDSTNTGVLWTIVLVGSFAMIAISAAVTAMVRAETNKIDRERPRFADLDTVVELKKAQQAELLSAPAWVDKSKGTVKVPIDLAKQLVVKELQENPAAASPPPPPGFVMPAPVASAPAGTIPVTAELAPTAPGGAAATPASAAAPATP
jgi:hypothetical protein